jgi:hypothetical protein
VTSPVTRGASAFLAAVALTLGSTAAASAATWGHGDATKDVETSTDGGATSTPDATNAVTDITQVRAANNTGTVVVRFRTRAALPQRFVAEAVIKTATGEFTADRVHVGSTAGVYLSNGMDDISCKGLTFAVVRSTRWVRVSVPRSCIGNPGWVRIGAFVLTMNADDSREWADDGLRTGMGSSRVLSPRIPRA